MVPCSPLPDSWGVHCYKPNLAACIGTALEITEIMSWNTSTSSSTFLLPSIFLSLEKQFTSQQGANRNC